ncbi:transformer-sr ribonucleoprotein [Diaporthe eres]|nr:transformer-sr ribonucleoprotein [Diaporthe eres]
MATTAMDYENPGGDRFEDEGPRYERDNRSASPRSDNGHDSARRRSASPGGDRGPVKDDGGGSRDGEGAINSGSNLFVTGIHPKLSEDEVTRLFSKYGNVEKCQIMRDPHTKESRGFGFVNFMTSDEADAARDGLQGKELEGRTLSIEKARRSRPRTPTPGKYFGPPKREGGGPPRGRFGGDRYGEDRRGYGGGRGGRYEDRGYRGYRDRDDRGGYDRGYRDDRGGYDRGYRDDRGGGYDRGYRGDDRGGYDRRDRDFEGGGGRIDRYASSGRDDRYGGGGGGPRFDRAPPRDAPAPGGYGEGTREYSLPRYGRD